MYAFPELRQFEGISRTFEGPLGRLSQNEGGEHELRKQLNSSSDGNHRLRVTIGSDNAGGIKFRFHLPEFPVR